MRDIIPSRRRRWGQGPALVRGSSAGSVGRRTLRPGFDRLEARRLLTAMPPAAEFPLRQFGGVPEGVVEDPNGNAWTLISPGTIAEDNNSGGLIAQYQVPTYDALAGVPSGSVLGLITYNAVDGDIWFYEAAANQMASLNPSTGAFAEYPLLPFASDPGIEQIVAGPDGNIYFTEPSLNEVGLFDVKTDRVSQFNMPLADTQPQGITVGGDGNLWFTEGGQNKIASLNPTTHLVTNYAFEPSTHTTNDQAEGITAGPNDTIWFVTQQNNLVNEFNIATDQFTNTQPYWPPAPPNPNPPTPVNADLWSIATGPDGNIYYTEPAYGWVGIAGGTIGRIYYNPNNPNDNTVGTSSEATLPYALIASGTTGVNMFISAPKAFSGAGTDYTYDVNTPKAGFSGASLPSVVVTTDANDVISVGNDLYFTDSLDGVGQIGEFNPTTQAYSVYSVPQLPPAMPVRNQYPNQMTVDSNGNIWFTETNAVVPGDPQTGAIGEFNPTTDTFSQSYLTASSSDPVGIAWDLGQEQFWMTEPNVNELVSYNPATTGSAVAPILSPKGGVITDPVGLVVDNNTGYVWIAEQSAKQIIAYDPYNESILFTFATKGQPDQLAWGPDGNIWFTESGDANSPGYVGVLVPSTTPGTGGIKAEVPVSHPASFVAAGPGSGTYANTMWFSMAGTNSIGEISTANDTLVGYSSAPDTDVNALAMGPDGNLWFTSGQGNPPWIGAVVLNPNDLGTQVVVTTQPPNVEETFFGGYNYSFGLTVAVENSAGQVDPFVQNGPLVPALTITLTLSDPSGSNGQLIGTVTVPVDDGLAVFDGLTIEAPFTGADHAPGQGYTIQATYNAGLNAPVTNPFLVTGPAVQIAVTTEPPSSVDAGTPFTVAVSAVDANGYIVPTFDDPIQLTIATNPNGNGVLNGTTILGALYGSAASANLSIDQEGNGYTLQGADLNPLVSFPAVTSNSFNVTAAQAVQLVFDPNHEPPATANAGQFFATVSQPLVVDAEDQFGQIDTTFNGQVTLTFYNGAAGKFDPGSTLSATAKDGIATFSNVAIDSAGKFQIQAGYDQLTPAVSSAITISPASPSALAWATEPPSTATAGVPFPVAFNVVDKFGNAEPTYSGTITLALALNGNADTTDLGGTTTGSVQDGTVTLSGVVINAVNSPFTLSATTGDGLKSPASSAVNVVAPKLVVTTEPSGDITTDSGFTIVVTAETSTGATDPDFTSNVSLSMLSGPTGAKVGGTTSETAQAGVATFGGVTVDTPGSYVLQAAGGIATPAQTQTLVAIQPQLVVTAQPTGQVTAGSTFTIVVTAETGSGATDTSFTGSVSLGIASGPSGATQVFGTDPVSAQAGVARFDAIYLKTAGTYFLQATNAGATPGNSQSLTVVASPTVASLYIIQQPPTTVQAGAGFGLEVGGEDQYGNPTDLSGSVTVILSTNPGNATLGGTANVGPIGGVVTFSDLTLDVADSGYVLQATQTGATSATTDPIGVTAGPAYQLAIPTTGEPAGTVDAGSPFSMTVDVEDKYGNLISGYSGSVSITQPTGIGGTTSAPVSSAGVATFNNLILTAAGTYQLKATSGTLNPATSGSVTVVTTSQTPAILAWSTTPPGEPPGQVTRNAGFGAVVDVEDPYGNLETDFNGDVSINLQADPGNTTLGGTLTVPATDGVATFSGLTIGVEADGYTLVASSGGVDSPASTPIDVSAVPPTAVAITVEPPATLQDTQSFGLTVQVWTSPNVVDTDFNGSVTLSIFDPAGSLALQGTTSVDAQAGIAKFSGLNLTQLGDFVLQASVTGLTPAESTGIAVSAGPAAKLVISEQPIGTVTAGSAFTFQVEALDAYGYQASNFDDLLSAKLSPNANNAALVGSPTALSNNGLATFTNLQVTRAGSGYTVEVTDTSPSSTLPTVTTSTVAVTPNTPETVEFTSPPPNTLTAGTPFDLTVGVTDAYGNVEPNYTGSVTISLANRPAAGPLGGNLTAPVTGGLANFTGLTLTRVANDYQILATCTTGSLQFPSTTSSTIAITPAAASQLVVTTEPPGSVLAGAEFGVAVNAEDPYGNTVTGFNGNVTLDATGPAGTAVMTGPLTMQATGGVASYPPTLAIDTAGNGWTIRASSPGLSTGSSTPISVTGLSPTHLAIVQQPPSTLQPGASFGFVVGAEDQYGNINPGFSGTIAIALQSANGATLGGTTQVAISNGVASFQGLTLSNLTTDVTILATNSALGQAQTAAIGPAPQSNPTGSSSSSSSAPVTVESIQVFTNKKKQVTEVLVTFSGALTPSTASIAADYRLMSPGKKNSYTAKNAKLIPFGSAVYNAGNDTVALTPAKRLVVKKPLQLTILGTGGSAIEDSSGRPLGGNTVAILSKHGKSVGVQTMAISSASVDVLLEEGPLVLPSKKSR